MTHTAFRPLTIADAAGLFDVCERTIKNWISDGVLLKPTKLGHKEFWHPELFYQWLDAHLRTSPTSTNAVSNNTSFAKPTKKSEASEVAELKSTMQSKLDKLKTINCE